MLICDCVTPEVRRAVGPVGVGGFEIGYVTDDGLEHRVSLSQAWATPFESCSPIRRFTSHNGQRHLSGLWWDCRRGIGTVDSIWPQFPSRPSGAGTACHHAVVSFFHGDRTQAIIIGVILVASIGLGFVNEYRAERASAVDKSRQQHPLRAPHDS